MQIKNKYVFFLFSLFLLVFLLYLSFNTDKVGVYFNKNKLISVLSNADENK